MFDDEEDEVFMDNTADTTVSERYTVNAPEEDLFGEEESPVRKVPKQDNQKLPDIPKKQPVVKPVKAKKQKETEPEQKQQEAPRGKLRAPVEEETRGTKRKKSHTDSEEDFSEEEEIEREEQKPASKKLKPTLPRHIIDIEDEESDASEEEESDEEVAKLLPPKNKKKGTRKNNNVKRGDLSGLQCMFFGHSVPHGAMSKTDLLDSYYTIAALTDIAPANSQTRDIVPLYGFAVKYGPGSYICWIKPGSPEWKAIEKRKKKNGELVTETRTISAGETRIEMNPSRAGPIEKLRKAWDNLKKLKVKDIQHKKDKDSFVDARGKEYKIEVIDKFLDAQKEKEKDDDVNSITRPYLPKNAPSYSGTKKKKAEPSKKTEKQSPASAPKENASRQQKPAPKKEQNGRASSKKETETPPSKKKSSQKPRVQGKTDSEDQQEKASFKEWMIRVLKESPEIALETDPLITKEQAGQIWHSPIGYCIGRKIIDDYIDNFIGRFQFQQMTVSRMQNDASDSEDEEE